MSFRPKRHFSARFRSTLTLIRILGHAGFDVIRTVWLAGVCLIGLGAMVGIKAGLPTSPPNVATSPEETTIGVGSTHDTLSKADRLEIAYDRLPAAVEPVVLATQVSDETSSQENLAVQTIVNRHWHDHTAKKSAAVSPDRRIKMQQPKNRKSVDRSRATVDLRPCRRPEGFAGLLKALNLSPGCDT
jgi:hypothetical protein